MSKIIGIDLGTTKMCIRDRVTETIAMIEEQNFDVRTITMGISLLDCIDSDIDKAAEKVYNKIVSKRCV